VEKQEVFFHINEKVLFFEPCEAGFFRSENGRNSWYSLSDFLAGNPQKKIVGFCILTILTLMRMPPWITRPSEFPKGHIFDKLLTQQRQNRLR
jgi:hypothetical protein